MSYRRLIIIAHATVLVVGILLSTLVYFQGRAVVHVSRLFAESDLVDLKTISGLKIAVVEYETILYEFYANTDRSKFSQKRQLNEANVAAGLDKIRAAFPSNNKFTAIEENYALVKLLSGQLDDTLKQREIDWDKARFLLLVISQLSTKINDNLDALVSSIQSRVLERGQEIQRKINYSVALVALFSATFFVVSIFVGYYVNTYLSEIAERRRLSMFAERNPNPVLSLSQKGEVVYASPSALELLKNVGTKTTRLEVLFPDDLAARLVTLFESGKDRDEWEYTVLGKTFSCGINLFVLFN